MLFKKEYLGLGSLIVFDKHKWKIYSFNSVANKYIRLINNFYEVKNLNIIVEFTFKVERYLKNIFQLFIVSN